MIINVICGLLAMGGLTAFIGGLSYSIWQNTGSIAFPVIVGLVLILAYVSFIDELRKGPDNT